MKLAEMEERLRLRFTCEIDNGGSGVAAW